MQLLKPWSFLPTGIARKIVHISQRIWHENWGRQFWTVFYMQLRKVCEINTSKKFSWNNTFFIASCVKWLVTIAIPFNCTFFYEFVANFSLTRVTRRNLLHTLCCIFLILKKFFILLFYHYKKLQGTRPKSFQYIKASSIVNYNRFQIDRLYFLSLYIRKSNISLGILLHIILCFIYKRLNIQYF